MPKKAKKPILPVVSEKKTMDYSGNVREEIAEINMLNLQKGSQTVTGALPNGFLEK